MSPKRSDVDAIHPIYERKLLERRTHNGYQRDIYEVPPPRTERVDELLEIDRSVAVYHYDHVARFPVPQWINPRGHYVYFVWGENVVEDNGEDYDILYIGMSSKILYRIAQHSLDSPWWVYADHIDVYQYATRGAAANVEKHAIHQYGPLYNAHYNGYGETPPDFSFAPTEEGLPPLVPARRRPPKPIEVETP